LGTLFQNAVSDYRSDASFHARQRLMNNATLWIVTGGQGMRDKRPAKGVLDAEVLLGASQLRATWWGRYNKN
jgi:hypothetical protein